MLKFSLSEQLSKLEPKVRKQKIEELKVKIGHSTISRIRTTKIDEDYSPKIHIVEFICRTLGINFEQFLNK
jgi:hypothetical protein